MDLLTIKDIIVNSTQILAFLAVYLVIKRTADEEMIKTLINALIIVCIFSSMIGIFQFLVNPLFFKLASGRDAFYGVIRSTGIYRYEYTQSYFLITGIILVLFTVRSKLLKYTLIGLFLFGIISTFHRMSWISIILLFALYLIGIKKKIVWKTVTVGSVLIVFIFLGSSIFFQDNKIKSSSFVQDRLLSDTLTNRIELYKITLKTIPQSWIVGFGSKNSNVYYHAMLQAGMPENWAMGEAGGIHNLYLNILFFKGIPSMILFLLFIIFAFRYFERLGKIRHIFYFIPLLELVKYTISNMSNSFPLSDELGLLLAILLGTGVAVYQKNISVNRLVNEKIYR